MRAHGEILEFTDAVNVVSRTQAANSKEERDLYSTQDIPSGHAGT